MLIVDNHDIFREVLREAAIESGTGASIRSAADGATALAEVRANQPTMVLMDVRMPGIDGIEATHHIRREFPHLFIVGMSLFGSGGEEMIAAGANTFVLKSALSSDLLRDLWARACAEKGKWS